MYTPEQQELLAKVKELRNEENYSQNEAAKIIGISATALLQIVKGNYPSDPQIYLIQSQIISKLRTKQS